MRPAHPWLAYRLDQALHPVFANRGYQFGRVVMISTHTSLMSMVTGVCIGIGVLDETWPSRPLMSGLRFVAFVLIVSGVINLNLHTITAVGREDLKAAASDLYHPSTTSPPLPPDSDPFNKPHADLDAARV